MLAGTGVRKISSVACGFSPVKIPKKLICRINEVYVLFKKIFSDILLKKKNIGSLRIELKFLQNYYVIDAHARLHPNGYSCNL